MSSSKALFRDVYLITKKILTDTWHLERAWSGLKGLP